MTIQRSSLKSFKRSSTNLHRVRTLQAEQLERRELLAADLELDNPFNDNYTSALSNWIAAPPTVQSHLNAPAFQEMPPLASSLKAEGEGGTTALDAYIAAPDTSYGFSILTTTAGTGYMVYDVAMTSQTWRSGAETTWNQWKHRVTIVIPNEVTSGKSLLMVGGGSHGGTGEFGNGVSQTEISAMASLALSTGTVVSNVLQVPYQPLQFQGETQLRSEDAIIAKTFSKFLDGGDDNWPTLLPMVKSVVRAMDTVQSIALAERSVTVTDFVVSGASKRGWTTWLTAAVDSRVSAIAPMVINVLNMDEQMAHHKEVYTGVTASIVGGYSFAVQDYVNEGVFNDLTSPRSQELLKIVDPFEYRDRLTIPKLMLNGTGDEFFVPDSDQFFFDRLLGNNYVRYLPNRGHGLGPEAITARNQFYQAMVSDINLPRFSWKVDPSGAIQVTTTDLPSSVKLWQSTNPLNRDFRQNISGTSWTSSPLLSTGPGRYVGNVVPPLTGHTAYFVELIYNVQDQPMHFTTQVNVRSANTGLGFITPAAPLVYTEDQAAVQVSSATTWFDFTSGNYNGSQLSISIIPSPGSTDQIAFDPTLTGLIVSGANVSEGGRVIARATGATATQLTWRLNTQTTRSSIEDLVRSITFRALGDAPDTQNRSIQFQLTKGDLIGVGAIAVSVIATNDAPRLQTAQMASIAEDSVDIAGQTVAELFSQRFSDPDPGSRLLGIAVVGNSTPASQGVWQIAFGNSSSWQNLPSVGPSNRLALDLTARLRFLPAQDYFGNVVPLMVQAIDDSYTGPFSTANNFLNLPSNLQGPQAPVSQAASELRLTVTPVNDAPRATVNELRFSVTQDRSINARIPSGTIVDVDDTVFTYEAVQIGELPLPDWLQFSSTGRFSGTPTSADVNDLQLLVRSFDPGGLHAAFQVNIQVVNVNDPPERLSFTEIKVPENSSGIRVGKMFAFDPDDDSLSWTVSDNRFIVQGNELFLMTPLDFETPEHRQISLTLRVADSGSPKLSATMEAVIELSDVNEFLPQLESASYKLLDGTAAGALLGVLQATDGDVMQKVRYRLHSGDVEDFEINSETGKLVLKSSVNIHNKAVHKVFVQAYDDAEPRFSSTAQFVVNVQQNNEHLPQFVANQELRFAENLPAETVVGQIRANDQDANPLRYELLSLSGGDKSWLSIDSQTGTVRLTGAHRFDFEAGAEHVLQIRVTETIDDGRSVVGNFPIRIMNANDPPSGLSPVSIYAARQGVQVLEHWLVEDQDRAATSSYRFSTEDERFEIRDGMLALKPERALGRNQVGQTLMVPVRVTDSSDASSFAILNAAVTVLEAAAWQNPINRLDVNRDGRVTANDALLVINQLNSDISQRFLSDIRPYSSLQDPDIDVSGDQRLSAIDALLIINFLNERSPGVGEGEQTIGTDRSSQPLAIQSEATEQVWWMAYSQLEEESSRKHRRHQRS